MDWRHALLTLSFLMFFFPAGFECDRGPVEADVAVNQPIQAVQEAGDTRHYEIRMPGVKPMGEDEYICHGWKVPDDELYVVQFEAIADQHTVHHLILSSCSVPIPENSGLNCQKFCLDRKIMYAWGRNAPSLQLPKDVAFRIGSSVSITHLVLEIHYKTPPTGEDHSGVRLTVTRQRQKYIAGIFLLVSNNLVIPAHSKSFHGDVSCHFSYDAVIHPFAFRTHAHSLGRVISGYIYNGSWHFMGKANPNWPQAFWPISKSYVIKKGDALVARCTYDSEGKATHTNMGSTQHDEMCNYYIMFYTDPEYGSPFYICGGNSLPDLVNDIPAGSDVPDLNNPYVNTTSDNESREDVELVDRWTKKMESGRLTFGQVSAVAVGANGSVYVFHRGQRVWDSSSFDGLNNFLQKDEGPIKEKTMVQLNSSSSDVIAQWADGTFYMPHGLHVDDQGNFWVTDVALHQVLKFGPQWPTSFASNMPRLVLGVKFEPGSDDSHFCKPTDVAVLHTGEFFVSDGYCNSRIMKFSATGQLLAKWGERSQQVLRDGFPLPSTFDIPHSIVVLENRRLVCAADRENARIQCFDFDGKFVRQIPSPDRLPVYAISCNERRGHLYAVFGPPYTKSNATLKGVTMRVEDGAVLSSWQPKTGFHLPHDVVVSPDGRLMYVSEIGPNCIWQFKINYVDHQSVKKDGAVNHPLSSGDEDEDEHESLTENNMTKDDGSYVGATIIIGGLILVPLVIMIVILIFLRYRRKEKQATNASRGNNRRFNLGSLLAGSRSSDFSGPADDERRLELQHLQSDSDVEEYSSVSQQNA